MRKLIIALSIIGAILLVSLIVIIVVIFTKKKDNGPNIGPAPGGPSPPVGPAPGGPTKSLVDVSNGGSSPKGETYILFTYTPSPKYTSNEICQSFKKGMFLTVVSGLNVFSPYSKIAQPVTRNQCHASSLIIRLDKPTLLPMTKHDIVTCRFEFIPGPLPRIFTPCRDVSVTFDESTNKLTTICKQEGVKPSDNGNFCFSFDGTPPGPQAALKYLPNSDSDFCNSDQNKCKDRLPVGKWCSNPNEPDDPLCYTTGSVEVWPSNCCNSPGFSCSRDVYDGGQLDCAMTSCIHQNSGQVPTQFQADWGPGWSDIWVCDMDSSCNGWRINQNPPANWADYVGPALDNYNGGTKKILFIPSSYTGFTSVYRGHVIVSTTSTLYRIGESVNVWLTRNDDGVHNIWSNQEPKTDWARRNGYIVNDPQLITTSQACYVTAKRCYGTDNCNLEYPCQNPITNTSPNQCYCSSEKPDYFGKPTIVDGKKTCERGGVIPPFLVDGQEFCAPVCASDDDCTNLQEVKDNSGALVKVKCVNNYCMVGECNDKYNCYAGGYLSGDKCCSHSQFGDLNTCITDASLNGLCVPGSDI